MRHVLIWALLLTGMATYASGEIACKAWSLKPNWTLFLVAVACYAAGGASYMPALRMHGSMGRLATVWCCLALILSVLIARYLFHESFTESQFAAVLLALVAMWLAY